MPWVTHGLREGIVTTRYPRRPDDYGPGFRAGVEVTDAHLGTDRDRLAQVASECPTGAIALGEEAVSLDRGKCIACGRCVESRPEVFAFASSPETSVLARRSLVVPPRPEDDAAIETLRDELGRRVRALHRSVHIRHVDCGSDGSEESEIAALTNPIYDVQRLGIYFTASPRHADILLATGAGAAGMVGPLRVTYDAMPSPKIVIAVGADAASGGLFADTYATRAGVCDLVPVDVFVPGSPPSPFAILHGILFGIGRVARSPR